MMHKRSIIVPKFQEAIEKLEYDSASEEDIITWSVTDEEFSVLYHIFRDINRSFSVLIDDYEDENIVDIDKLKEIQQYLVNNHKENLTNRQAVKKLISFFDDAIERRTGVFFYM